MAKFSRKGWSSDFRESNFTGDQLARYKEGLRDEMNGRRDPVSRTGKTVRKNPLPREPFPERTKEGDFKIMLDSAKSGDIQRQFLVGREYVKRGDLENARFWLDKAALHNYPGAKDELAKLVAGGGAGYGSHISDYSMLPRVKYFKVLKFALSRTSVKYVLLVRISKDTDVDVPSRFLREHGLEVDADVYESEGDAMRAGFMVKRTWGRTCPKSTHLTYR